MLLLAAYVLAGTALAPFHGDEARQAYTARDGWRLVHDPAALLPGHGRAFDDQLRIINGGINRYTVAAGWALAGGTPAELPGYPGWNWKASYDANVAAGRRPPEHLLVAARAGSAMLGAGAVAVLFALGRRVGGRAVAYVGSSLFATSPPVLLGVRRATMEGSLMFFGLAALLVAAGIAATVAAGAPVRRRRWVLLAVTAALAMLAKQTAAILLVAAWVWVLGALVLAPRPPGGRRRPVLGGLAAAATGAALLWTVLSPAMWGAPWERVAQLLVDRAGTVSVQERTDPGAPMTPPERLAAVVRQPFAADLQLHESLTFAAVERSGAWAREAAAYQRSWLSGVQLGRWLGAAVTLVAAGGLAMAAVRAGDRRRLPVERAAAAGLAAWTLLTALALLANPLPWQRYYLVLVPPLALCAGVCLVAAAGALVRDARGPVHSAG